MLHLTKMTFLGDVLGYMAWPRNGREGAQQASDCGSSNVERTTVAATVAAKQETELYRAFSGSAFHAVTNAHQRISCALVLPIQMVAQHHTHTHTCTYAIFMHTPELPPFMMHLWAGKLFVLGSTGAITLDFHISMPACIQSGT